MRKFMLSLFLLLGGLGVAFGQTAVPLSGLPSASQIFPGDLFYDVQTPGLGGVKVTASQLGGFFAPHVASNALLAAATTTNYPSGVWRDSFSASVAAAPLFYAPSALACSLNAGAGDNGSQVQSSDGKCWLARFAGATFDIREFGSPCNGSSDDAPAITSAVSAASVVSGGKVQLCSLVHTNSTITLSQSNVELIGNGSGVNFNGASPCVSGGTIWSWGGSAGDTIVKMTSPSVVGGFSSINGGIEDVCLSGAGNAGIGIEVVNRYGFKLHNISVEEFTSFGILFTTAVTSSINFGNQRGDVRFIYCKQLTVTAPCMSLDGVAAANANTSINEWRDFEFSIFNGNGIEFHNSDTNIIRHVRVFASGSGVPVKFFGASAGNTNASFNIVDGLSGNTAAIFDNTSAVPSSFNSVLNLDKANGNPIPQLTGGGNVIYPYGHYSYDDQSVASINGCPLTFPFTVGGTSYFALGCPIDVHGGWSYFGFNSGGTFPSTTVDPLAVATNFSNGLSEIDLFNTNTGAIDTFHWYQQTGASAATLLAALTPTKFNLNSSVAVSWNGDAGISRVGAGGVAVGNGTQGDRGGGLFAAQYAASFNDIFALDINSPGGLKLATAAGVYFSSTANWFGTLDTGLSRDSAGVIDVGTGAQGSKAGSLNATNTTLTGTATAHRVTGNTSSAPTANSCVGFSLATGSSDFAGKVTFTSATSCSITFGSSFTNAPFCTVSPGSAASTSEAVSTTGGVTFTFGTANTSLSYICAGA